MYYRTISKRVELHSRPRHVRTGIATCWIVLAAPVMLLLVDLTHVWVAQIELQNAMNSAALAAVNDWGDAGGMGTTEVARELGLAFARANKTVGESLLITSNHKRHCGPNENAQGTGTLVFGSITNDVPWLAFDALAAPDCGRKRAFGVRAQSTLAVQSACAAMVGLSITPYRVSAQATARYECSTGEVVLVPIAAYRLN